MFFDMLQLLVIIFIFLAAYGVSSQAILYPNEWRPMEILSNILYIPFYHMFGELYIAERNDWPFEDQLEPPDGCFVGNREDIATSAEWNETDVIRCPNKNVTVSFLQGMISDDDVWKLLPRRPENFWNSSKAFTCCR